MHDVSSFNTLTYSDFDLPSNYSVSIRPLQLFMKRVRKRFGPTRFFLCAEYGEQTLRPHYHVILFGQDFREDRKLWRRGNNGDLNYRSETLEKLWPFGFAETASLTRESAGYTARYMVKKIYGDKAKEHYLRTHPLTGQLNQVEPEFIRMSTKPGLGATWYEKYKSDCFPSDFLINRDGIKQPIPRYYVRIYERDTAPDPADFGDQIPSPFSLDPIDTLKNERITDARERNRAHPLEQTPDRLAVKEEILHLRAAKLIRPLE